MKLNADYLHLLCCTYTEGRSGCAQSVYWWAMDEETGEMRYCSTSWSEEHDLPVPRLFDCEAEMNCDIATDLKLGANFDVMDGDHADFYRRQVIESLEYLPVSAD